MTQDGAPTHNVRPELHHLLVPLDKLRPHPRNDKLHDLDVIVASLRYHGQYRAITYQASTGYVLTGNGTYEAACSEGWSHMAATPVDCDDDQALRILAVDNASHDAAGYDAGLRVQLLQALGDDLSGSGYTPEQLAAFLAAPEVAGPAPAPDRGPSLRDRFMVPPFSVLDGRQGWWRDRKRAWLSLGIESELGRDGQLQQSLGVASALQHAMPHRAGEYAGGPTSRSAVSVFDPVLCEVVYRWFSREGDLVLDPYAGGSVRGIVASRLGREYVGCELRTEQVEANDRQAEDIIGDGDPLPDWRPGDCGVTMAAELELRGGPWADLVFTCPPYFDLERYSDDERDLSAMSSADFVDAYGRHLRLAADCLRPDRFAVVVVGSVRDSRGAMRDLRALTVSLAQQAGLHLSNDAVLITPVGSLPVRTAKQFVASRALGRTHQDVLVLYKGDRKRAADAAGEVNVDDALDRYLVQLGEDADDAAPWAEED